MSAATVTQLDVRATMAHLGGYWPASAGVLRLLEELGEVAELLGADTAAATDAAGAGALAEELADVWIISTVVADQYLAAVAPLDVSPGAEPGQIATDGDSAPEFAALVAAAGQIARVVNYYDGPKAPRTRDNWAGMQPAIDALHRALRAFAGSRDIDLGPFVAEKLARSRAVDAGRFARTFDPSTAPVLDRLRAAHPELSDARLFGTPDWPDGPFELGYAALRPVLQTFLKAAGPEHLDGLVVPTPQQLSADALTEWWRDLAAALSAIAEPATFERVDLDGELGHALLAAPTETSNIG